MKLPATNSEEDIKAVTRNVFKKADARMVSKIAGYALLSKRDLSAVGDVANEVRAMLGSDDLSKATLDHVHRAIYDYLFPSDKAFLEGMEAARNAGRKIPANDSAGFSGGNRSGSASHFGHRQKSGIGQPGSKGAISAVRQIAPRGNGETNRIATWLNIEQHEMSECYKSFDAFTKTTRNAPLKHFTSVGIIHGGRRFWSKKLARWLGQRGKTVRFTV